MTVVNLVPSKKELDQHVNYRGFNSFNLSTSKIATKNVNFHMQSLLKEVKQQSRKERKAFMKVARGFLATAIPFLTLSSRSMAQESEKTTPVSSLPTEGVGIPPELLELMLTVLTVTVGGAIILCIILLAFAGVWRALRRGKDAQEWTVDIIKGLTQVLLAAPIVFLIYWVASELFKTSGWFVSPF